MRTTSSSFTACFQSLGWRQKWLLQGFSFRRDLPSMRSSEFRHNAGLFVIVAVAVGAQRRPAPSSNNRSIDITPLASDCQLSFSLSVASPIAFSPRMTGVAYPQKPIHELLTLRHQILLLGVKDVAPQDSLLAE
jgi:hypothetical protein